MPRTLTKTQVRGGTIARSAKTGRFVSVTSATSTTRASAKTAASAKVISERRSEALKRLVDR